MKTNNTWILLTVLSAMTLLQACTPASDDENVQKNVEAAEKLLHDLPELKEEIDEYKDKVNAQKITGVFSGEMDGEAFEFSNWKAQYSRITFLDFKGYINAALNKKPSESVNIEFVADKWFDKQFPVDVAASVFVTENGEYLKVIYTKKDANGDVVKTFQSAEGIMTVKQFNNEKVTVSFEGEGFIGDVRLQERAPLSFELDLDYNFISSDARSVQ